MKVTLSFILMVISTLVSSQKPELNDLYNPITFGGRAFAFVTYSPDTTSQMDEAFAFNNSTQLVGVNFSINYNIINGISIGVASGIERFLNPNFRYIPLYGRLAFNGGTQKSSFHTELNIGGHFTNDSRRGGLHRFLLGYRFRIHKSLFGDLSMIYTYQNLFQNFDNSKSQYNNYNFESLGLSFGLDLN